MTFNRDVGMARFRTRVSSDVDRDGLGVEPLDASGGFLAEVFRCDRDHTLTTSLTRDDLPANAMEQPFARAWVGLDPFEDGTPRGKAA